MSGSEGLRPGSGRQSRSGGATVPTARIVMSAALPGVEFIVVNGEFQQVARGIGRLAVDLDSGIYEVSTRAGGRVETELVALEAGETWSRQDVSMEVFSAAPLTRSRTALSGQAEQVAALSAEIGTAAGPEAALVLVVRRVDQEAREPIRYRRLSLLDQRLEPVPGCVWHEDAEVGMATMAIRLVPGAYVVRFTPPAGHGPPLDQTLWLSAGWQSLVFCPTGSAGGDSPIDTDNASVHMTRLHEPFVPDAYEAGAAMEIAMSGLRQGLPLVSDDLPRLLQGRNVNPMLGIVSANAVLLAPQPDLDLYWEVTRLLRELLPGHPDVIALTQRLDRRLRLQPSPPVWWPPMLAASYDALLAADRVDPAVIQDDSVAERVAGYVVRRGPWLNWEASAAILAPPADVPQWPPAGGSSATTVGATRRVQRHVLEVAQLTGASPHQVAGSLGVDELARRLELPVQTVRLVLQELGWSTLFVPTPDVPSRGEERVDPVPEGRSPFESGPGRRRWWWLIAPLAVLLVIGGAVVVLANRDDDPVDGNSSTGPRTDLKVTIHGNTEARLGRRITPYVQLLNLGTSPAHPKLTITVPTQFELTGPVRGCTGERTLTCTVGISAGGRVPVNLPLIARRTGHGNLRADAVSDIEEVNPGDNSASIRLTAFSRPPTSKPTTPPPTTPIPTTPLPTTPLPTSPLPTSPPG